MTRNWQERLAHKGLLVADGATGTMLQAAGLPQGRPPEEWNLTQPEKIRALHRAYIEAGAEIILTNSFGGNRLRLERYGLADQTVELNRTAATLARQEAGDDALVAASMGPSGALMEPLGPLSFEDAVEVFAQQAGALAEGGADIILIETMSDLNEAKAAIEGARQATTLPIFCTMSFDSHMHTMMGVSPTQAAEELSGLEVEVIGANCGHAPEETEQIIREMKAACPQAVVWAKPNAGLPQMINGQVVYDLPPEKMGELAVRFAQAGASIIGSCCGSTPEHTAAIAAALRP
ncbi:MAG: homocysteine S-methyltransferase family protein [Anaerolineae bacterium]